MYKFFLWFIWQLFVLLYLFFLFFVWVSLLIVSIFVYIYMEFSRVLHVFWGGGISCTFIWVVRVHLYDVFQLLCWKRFSILLCELFSSFCMGIWRYSYEDFSFFFTRLSSCWIRVFISFWVRVSGSFWAQVSSSFWVRVSSFFFSEGFYLFMSDCSCFFLSGDF